MFKNNFQLSTFNFQFLITFANSFDYYENRKKNTKTTLVKNKIA